MTIGGCSPARRRPIRRSPSRRTPRRSSPAPMAAKPALNAELAGPPNVQASLNEEADQGLTLKASHEGYAARFGVSHARRIRLTPDGLLIQGEDTLAAPKGLKGEAQTSGGGYAVHFHLHPDVLAQMAEDEGSVTLILPNRRILDGHRQHADHRDRGERVPRRRARAARQPADRASGRARAKSARCRSCGPSSACQSRRPRPSPPNLQPTLLLPNTAIRDTGRLVRIAPETFAHGEDCPRAPFGQRQDGARRFCARPLCPQALSSSPPAAPPRPCAKQGSR